MMKLCLIMLGLLASDLAAAEQNDNCKPTIDGNDYDFTALTKTGTEADYRAKSKTYEYYVNVCGLVNDKGCDAAACQYEKDGDYVSTLGRFSASDTAITWAATQDGLIMTMANGDTCNGAVTPRTTHLELICASTAVGSLMVIDDSSMHSCTPDGYVFRLETCHACVGGCGGSGSSILVGGFLVVLVYLGLGVLYNHKVSKMSLKESFPPNKEFWAELPSLVSDGCVWTCLKLSELKEKIKAARGGAQLQGGGVGGVGSGHLAEPDETQGLLDDDDFDLVDDDVLPVV